MKKQKEEVEKKGLKLSVTENGKEGKSKMIASCGFLESELCQFSEEEVETLGVDLRTKVKSLGVKEKARRKKFKVRFSLTKKNKTFQKKYTKVGVKELLREEGGSQEFDSSWYGASLDLGSPCSGDVSYGEGKI